MPYFVNSEGLDIYYEEHGQGNPKTIVFLNGFSMTHRTQLFIVKQLQAKYHCVLMDYRGTGTSAPSTKNSMLRCAIDVKDLIEYLGLENVTLDGGSMGLAVIYAYFKAFGNLHVERTIMFDQSPYLIADDNWKLSYMRGTVDKTKLLEMMADQFNDPDLFRIKMMECFSIEHYGLEDQFPEEMIKNNPLDLSWIPKEDKKPAGGFIPSPREMIAKGFIPQCDLLGMIATWYDSIYQDYRPVLPNIKVPSLVFAPNPGTEFSFETMEYVANHLGGPVKFVELKPGTHTALYEHFGKVIKSIHEFMDTDY